MRPRDLSPTRAATALASATLSTRFATGLFGAFLASAIAFYGWVAHYPEAGFFDLVCRIPASLVCGLPFYAAAGFLFAQWMAKPPYPLSEVKGFGRLPVLLSYGAICGGLRWFVTSTDTLVHYLHGEEAPTTMVNLFLLFPQAVFSALLASAVFAYPGHRLEKIVRSAENPQPGRVRITWLAAWGVGAWAAAFLLTYAFESGAGSLVPSFISRGE